MAGHGATLAWDRTVTDDVDAEVELGRGHRRAGVGSARRTRWATSSATPASTTSRPATSGWTATSGCSASRCPGSARSGRGSSRPTPSTRPTSACAATIDGEPIQEGRTTQMRYGIAEVIAYLSQHLELRPGRPHRHRHPAAPRDAARTRTPAACRRYRDGLHRGDRTPDHDHRLTATKEHDMTAKPPTVFFGEMTDPEVRAALRRTQTIIIPTGSTEQHGPHGPLLTDAHHPDRGRPPRRRADRRARRPDHQLLAVVPARRVHRRRAHPGRRRSCRSSRTCARRTPRSASPGSCSSTATTTTRTPSPMPAPAPPSACRPMSTPSRSTTGTA